MKRKTKETRQQKEQSYIDFAKKYKVNIKYIKTDFRKSIRKIKKQVIGTAGGMQMKSMYAVLRAYETMVSKDIKAHNLFVPYINKMVSISPRKANYMYYKMQTIRNKYYSENIVARKQKNQSEYATYDERRLRLIAGKKISFTVHETKGNFLSSYIDMIRAEFGIDDNITDSDIKERLLLGDYAPHLLQPLKQGEQYGYIDENDNIISPVDV